MLQWIAHLISAGGPWGVALLMAIQNVVQILPSELIMPFAGYVADHGRMTLWSVTVFGATGSALGALVVYYAARRFGERALTAWLNRHGRWLLRSYDLKKAEAHFSEHGARAVFFAQLIPGLRGVISLPAGFSNMNGLAFVFWTFAGSLIWCAGFAYAGKLLGNHFMKIDQWLGPTGWIVLAALLVAGFVWLVRRRNRYASLRLSPPRG